jgi:hypothetical protein
MRATGQYATYRGADYLVGARGAGDDDAEYVGLVLGDDATVTTFDRVVERANGGRLAKVRRDELDRFEQVTITGIVDGAEVTMYGAGDVVPCTFVGDPAWADAHGFTGSQHDGWSGDVALTDITGISETRVDLLHPADANGNGRP